MTDAAPIQQVFGDLAKTFVDTAEEIVRAREKHGEQKHLPLINRWTGVGEYARMERGYKHACDDALERGDSSWDFILLEEVYEALAALQRGDVVEGRAELIQVIAMAASMVEIIDSNALESLS